MNIKKIALAGTAVLFALSLTACSTTMASTKTTTETLNNGGTVECVLSGAGSGSISIYCIEATYIPPVDAK